VTRETTRKLGTLFLRYVQDYSHLTASAQEDGSFIVTDAWESADLLAEFGKALIPALQKVGVTPVEPAVYPIHNIIEG